MAGHNSGRIAQTTQDWMRDMEKRTLHEGRRPQIRTAADLLGPGLGPYAVEIQDWNEDRTTFNGFFFSDPNNQTQNSPDNTKFWMGYVIAEQEGYGYQRVLEYRTSGDPNSVVAYTRRFATPPGLLRSFGPWIPDKPPVTRIPGCLVSKINFAQTVVANTYLMLNWDGPFDLTNPGTECWSAAAPQNLVAPIAGRYTFSGSVLFQNNATGFRLVQIRRISDGALLQYLSIQAGSANPTTVVYGLSDMYFTAGDGYQVWAFHTGSATLGVGGTAGAVSRASLTYIGPP